MGKLRGPIFGQFLIPDMQFTVCTEEFKELLIMVVCKQIYLKKLKLTDVYANAWVWHSCA